MSEQNREKLTPSPPCPKNVRTGSTTPCPCGHTINFEKSKVFCAKKCGHPRLKNSSCPQYVRPGQTPLTADVFYGRPFQSTKLLFGECMCNMSVPERLLFHKTEDDYLINVGF